MNDEVNRNQPAALATEPRLSEHDLRLHCLGMANNGSDAPAKVVERAETYLKFLKAEIVRGVSDAEEEAQ